MLKTTLSEKTTNLRHLLVRLIAPNLYASKAQFPRPMISFIAKNYQKRALTGVEIGVAQAYNAESILESLPIKKLYLVDPYMPYLEAYGWVDPRQHFLMARKRLSRFEEKVVFIKKKSSEAVDDVPNNLDFVYIDGNHSYEFVRKDIELYYPKVSRGGVLGGHDFYASFLGVCRAVTEFADKKGLKLSGEKYDWWLVKASG